MKIYDFEQRTPEWYEIRKFKMTASNANTIKVNGKGLDTYILTIVSEGLSTGPRDDYTNDHMERGKELEEQAKVLYELETGNNVKEVGFVEFDKYTGCSPDGLVGDDGGIEIKSMMDRKHFEHMIGIGKIENAHYSQMQMCMYITDRKWWDYILYNPNFTKSLIIERVYRDEKLIEQLKIGLEAGKAKIKEYLDKYEKLGSI